MRKDFGIHGSAASDCGLDGKTSGRAKSKKARCLINLLLAVSIAGTYAKAEDDGLKLHYDAPAKYFEESLVIGNGTMGACVYGGVAQDVISLNDITLWTGEPERPETAPDACRAVPEVRRLLDEEDYRGADIANRKIQGHYSQNYQPLGTLVIDYCDGDTAVSGYRRHLDIGNATAHVQYLRRGRLFQTDYFASAPDSVIVIRLKSEDERGISAIISFDSPLPHTTLAQGSEISAEGYAAYHSYPSYYSAAQTKHLYDPGRGVHFRTLIRVAADGGKVEDTPEGGLKIDGCREATVLVANVTGFNGFDKDPVREGRDYSRLAEDRINAAAGKTYDRLRSAHIQDYRHYFDRVSLNLGKTDGDIARLSTDRQLRLYTDCQQDNPELEALYFQYGRYLLISCSRTPGVPANLQGLWNESILPPWSCNYTTNINLEENYWAAETANLSEMHLPLLGFIANAAVTGAATAKAYYGVSDGWCMAHNSDIWAMTCPVGLKAGDPSWACWPMGGAWLSTHIWEHYLFTQDRAFLREYYPVLKGAAAFCIGWLVEKDGYLLTSPGTSPENTYLTPDGYVGATSYGNTSDLAMIRECLCCTREAAKVLKKDKALQKKIDRTLEKIYPYQIGKEGNLQEWYHDWPDSDPHHRHQSHLFGLYPGHQISVERTPELAAACARTLEMRGDKTTGWSSGWRINLNARLRDGEKSYRTLRNLLRYISPDNYEGDDASRGGGTYPNLLDAHSPFQIDGNFGGCAAYVEMLMQSTPNTITLLPAIPAKWREGSVRGICARGGFVVDMDWKEGKVTFLTVHARNGGKTTINFNGTSKTIRMKAGETRNINQE